MLPDLCTKTHGLISERRKSCAMSHWETFSYQRSAACTVP